MKTMRLLGGAVAVLAVASVWAVGCGGSTDDTAATPPATGGTGGSTAADTGTPDVVEEAVAETGTPDAPKDVVKKDVVPKEAAPPVQCGTETCDNILGTPAGDIMGCCSPNTKCGIIPPALANLGNACVEKNQPGNLDKACPDTSLAGLLTAPGCCTPGGICGSFIDVNVAGIVLPLGCVDPKAAGITPDGGYLNCTPTTEGGTTDAAKDTGTTDTGTTDTGTTDTGTADTGSTDAAAEGGD